MFLQVFTNNKLRKKEYTKEDLEYKNLLSYLPNDINLIPNVISDDVNGQISFYFSKGELSNVHNRDDVECVALKLNPVTNEIHYKWYVLGNFLNVELGLESEIIATGFYSNSTDVCAYYNAKNADTSFINHDFRSIRFSRTEGIVQKNLYKNVEGIQSVSS